jgi:endo-1,4-beta-D-glucanase Y
MKQHFIIAWLCLVSLWLLGCAAPDAAQTRNPGCLEGESACDGFCVDLMVDEFNCGSCGVVCGEGATCEAGTCTTALSCAPGQLECRGACVDPLVDNNNCGRCGNICPTGTSCQSGTCAAAPACPEGLTACGTVCVNLMVDSTNCGECGRRCTSTESCQSGVCAPARECPVNQTDCGGVCTNLNTDINNCGRCGNVCASGESCQSGVCAAAIQCPAGQTDCGGVCTNLLTDIANCGSCGNTCSGGQNCVNGACTTPVTQTCVAPEVECAGVCTNTQTDNANCGSCGNVCSGGKTCQAGVCTCPADTPDCDGNGTCDNVQTDANNCGGCNVVCGSGATCVSGQCQCPTGRTDCGDGVCRDLNSDVNNCGQCGNACDAGLVCSGGTCTTECGAGLTNCDGSCVDLNTDEQNCGSCGYACAAGQTCSGGSCGGCAEGTTDCDGECVDLNSDNENCGACGEVCSGGKTCQSGSCECPAGQIDCSGTCYEGDTCPDCPLSAGMVSNFEDQSLYVADQAAENWDGFWEYFNDGASTQTLEVVSTDVHPDSCGEYALHTSGSGFNDWGAGIGFILRGTDTNDPDEYDASKWTGIRFKARLGNSSTTPVRFNVSTPWTEKTESGGTCTGDDGGPPEDRCYNHVGRFLYDLGTSWKEYFFCFDRDLYPMFLPSNLSNTQRETISSHILKVQFSFNRAKDLPDLPDPDVEYFEYDSGTPFDFWVDDVEFVTDACPDTDYQSSSGTAHPFPQNANLGNCAPVGNASIFNAAIATAYEHWMNQLVVSDSGGLRVRSPEHSSAPGATPSEAMGYGMMIAAAMGDKETFDGFWTYTQTQLSGGLMTWLPGNSGSATDADEDIAFALLMAQDQWGGSYSSAASSMISAMSTSDVDGGHLTAGSNWSGQDAYNPSYFAPSFYPAFGGGTWSTVSSNGYTTLGNNQSQFGSGLFTDWCRRDGTPIRAEDVGAQVTGGFTAPVYGYDAARVPWRLGLDACANGNSQATSLLTPLLSFFASQYSNGDEIDLLKAGWYSGGVDAGDLSILNQMSFIGPVGVAAMAVSSRSNMRDRAFRAVLDIIENPEFNRTYYPTTLGLITLLTMSGNLPHP